MDLKNKYRPRTMDAVLGNEDTKNKLKSLLTANSLPHSILFEGETGCGKTTLAWIVAKETGTAHEEIQYYNASNTRGIDTIRGIDNNCRYGPLVGEYKSYIIDECHKITNEGQNALLALLDEPPPHVYFFLCTTQPHKLLREITKGRTMRLKVETLSYPLIINLVRLVIRREGKTETFPRSAIQSIASRSEGIPRNALTLLQAVINMTSASHIQ